MKTVGLIACLAVFAPALVAANEIKSTTRITISTAGRATVEVRDPAVLALSNVFAGTFIGEAVQPLDASLDCFIVTFDIQARDGIKERAYQVTYCRNSAGRGFVYLPGSGDAYRRNVSTIIRDTQDGRWHRASDQWSAAIDLHLP